MSEEKTEADKWLETAIADLKAKRRREYMPTIVAALVSRHTPYPDDAAIVDRAWEIARLATEVEFKEVENG